MFQPVSGSLQSGIRFFKHPLPPKHSAFLTICLPDVYLELMRLTTFRHRSIANLAACYRPRRVVSCERCKPPSLSFSQIRGFSHLPLLSITVFTQVQLPSAYSLPRAYPVLATREIFCSRFGSRTFVLCYFVPFALYSEWYVHPAAWVVSSRRPAFVKRNRRINPIGMTDYP